jgi:hypothetical protein
VHYQNVVGSRYCCLFVVGLLFVVCCLFGCFFARDLSKHTHATHTHTHTHTHTQNLFTLMIEPPNDELLPVLAAVISYLLDDDCTRQFVFVPHDIKVLLAPLTDTYPGTIL